MKASNAELGQVRASSAEQLEVAIAALGTAYEAYTKATLALEFRLNVELGRGLEAAIVLHLAGPGGLSSFLERRLVGVAPSLRALVERQHQRTGVYGLRA